MLDTISLVVLFIVALLGTATVFLVWYYGSKAEEPVDDGVEYVYEDVHVSDEEDLRKVNVRTRGDPGDFVEIGILYATTGNQAETQQNNVLPLYGRQTHARSYRWNYYTEISGRHVPLQIDGAMCMKSLGCNELYSKDRLKIPELDNLYTFEKTDEPPIRYIPHV